MPCVKMLTINNSPIGIESESSVAMISLSSGADNEKSRVVATVRQAVVVPGAAS